MDSNERLFIVILKLKFNWMPCIFYLLNLENIEKAYVVSKYERLEWQTKENSNLKTTFPVGDSLKIKMFLNLSF